jgi:radical SAM protein with 4Fe4S-binding SPASM domain
METAEQVLQYIAMLSKSLPKNRHISLCMFGGEPFLNFEVMKYVVEEADKRKLPTGRAVMTNGATATPDQIEWCKSHRIIPKRSATGCPEACELTRPGTYLERYHAESAHYSDYGRPRRITVIPETAGYMMQTIRYFQEKGYWGMLDFSTDDYADWSDDAIQTHKDQLTRMAHEVVRQFRLGHVLCNEVLFLVARKAFESGRIISVGCGAGWGLQAITWDGYVVPCVKPDTLVNTGSSFIPISSVKEGDAVVGHSGQIRNVTKIWERPYSGDMVNILTKGSNEPIAFTPEHPVYAITGRPCANGRLRCRPDCPDVKCRRRWDSAWGVPEWKDAKDVTAADCVVYPIDRRVFTAETLTITETHRHNAKAIPATVSITPALLRLFGWYISEGCAHPTSGTVAFTLHEDEREDAEWIADTIHAIFGLFASVKPKGTHGLRVVCHSVRLSRALLAMFGRGAANKRIPDSLMTLPPDQQLPMLQSLFYGDGGTDRQKNAFFSTISGDLAYQVKMLLLRQETIPSMRRYYATRHHDDSVRQDEYRVYVYDRAVCQRLFSPRWNFSTKVGPCAQGGWISGDMAYMPVRSVTTEHYDGPVHNLEVEHDNSYVLTTMVAHNCHRFLREPRDSGFCGGKLSDVLAGKPVAFGEAFREHVYRCSRKEETPECFSCGARQTCQHGCAHVSHIATNDLMKTPRVRCEIAKHYHALAFWVHGELKRLDPEWYNKKPTKCAPIPEDA